MPEHIFKPGEQVFVTAHFGAPRIAKIASVGKLHIRLEGDDRRFRLDGWPAKPGFLSGRSSLEPITNQPCRDKYFTAVLERKIERLTGIAHGLTEAKAKAAMAHVEAALVELEGPK